MLFSPMDRQIVCFQIPAFQIAVARLGDLSLRGRPVAIAPHSPRAVLGEVSSEARGEGLHSGMPVDQARFLCPSLRLLLPDPRRIHLAQRHLFEVAGQFAPVFEPVSPGHLFLDLTGTARLFGRAVDTAAHMEREVIGRCGVSGAIGVGSSKLVSGIATTLIKPPELYDVSPGAEETFLAPLPVTSLPGLSHLYADRTGEVLATLDDLNLRTLGEIAGIPPPHLELVLGPPSRLLHQWALGIDSSPVWPPIRRPALEVSHTLKSDEVDDGLLLAVLYGLLERLCSRLRLEERVCRRLKLVLTHSDGMEVSRQQSFSPGTCWEAEIYPCLQELFFRSFKRRVRIRTVALSAEVLDIREKQLSLFPEPLEENSAHPKRLALALDRLRARYGEDVVSWGATKSRDWKIEDGGSRSSIFNSQSSI